MNRCLKSILENKPAEIIVVDDNSTDATVQVARKYTDKIYSAEGRGLAYARQLGAMKAKGDFVAYVDSDTELPNGNVLGTMLREIKESEWIVIHAQLFDPTDKKTYWQRGEDFHLRKRFNKAGERRKLRTTVCLTPRDIILNYKFDLFFKGAGEDVDFFYRVRKDGYKLGVSSVSAYHYHRVSFKEFLKQKIWFGKAAARFFWKHKAVREIVFPVALILFGVVVCIKNRSIKMFPYYLTWGIFSGIGMLKELLYLTTMRVLALSEQSYDIIFPRQREENSQ
jgi:glycosyltransferase involved in cell wall biosynthesis